MHVTYCHDCNLAVHIPRLKHKQEAHCPRCGHKLSRQDNHSTQTAVAFALAAIVCLTLTLPYSFLTLSASGQTHEIGLIDNVTSLIAYDFWPVAAVLVIAVFAVPLIILLTILYLLLPIMLRLPVPPAAVAAYRLLFLLTPWGMAEIFLIGTLVSLVKIVALAHVSMGLSFYAFLLFSLFAVIAINALDRHQLRLMLDLEHRPIKPHPHRTQATWALLVTALILYIPASTLPIMTTRLLGQDDPSTIMGGVLVLWAHGDYPIALVIFVASVFVPIAKIIALAWLNYSVQRGENRRHHERIVLYRITEFIGRWSMIDVFVVAILVGLIQLGNAMSIYPGSATLSFSGVVILTMLAAISFNSHLIWQSTDDDKP